MNISYNWLEDLIDLDLSPDETAAALTRVGLAVEGVHPHGDDFVLDIDLTSNRPDCLSHRGVARELGVSLDRELKLASVETELPMPAVLAGETVQILDPDLCHRFTARIIRGVKIGPSPQWLVDRLEAIGERSINNVADITNYVMHELGQPMHAFDQDKLAEKRIVVRRAKDGEKITSLDEAEHELNSSMVVVCDAERPQGIGGIIGGWDSRITDDTTNVLLEVAYFDRASVRQTGRKLGITTEAGYRFERGVDVDNIKRASDRATQLICELAGGEKGEFIDIYPKHVEKPTVRSADISAATKRLTGLDVSTDECDRILHRLGIATINNGEYSSPTWRHDIAIEEDLIEEVARHAGYENISDELPPAFGAGEYQPTEPREKLLRQTLAGQGFDEALSYSFIDTRHDEVFAIVPGLLTDKVDDPFVTLRDSVIEGAVRMRATTLPGLLDAVRHNFNHQRRDLRMFEIGKAYGATHSEDHAPNEQKLLGLVITGGETFEGRAMTGRELDYYDVKGSVEAALDAVGISDAKYRPTDVAHLRKGQSASILIDGYVIGYVGRINDQIAESYKFKQPVYVAELDLQTALEKYTGTPVYRPLAKYPSITRDVSFVVKRNVSFEAIRDIVVARGTILCRSVMFVDIYEGKGIAEDERSITIRLEYRNDERTLVEEEVEVEHQSILAILSSELGISQRV